MANDNYMCALQTFETLCRFLDNDDWKYQKNEEKMTIDTGAKGEDLPMRMRMEVSAERQRILMFSVLPFKVPEDKRVELAVAVAAINNHLLNGAFDYSIQEGNIIFKMSNSFVESTISEELIKYMIYISFHTIDEYNEKLYMLTNGLIDIGQFLAVISNED